MCKSDNLLFRIILSTYVLFKLIVGVTLHRGREEKGESTNFRRGPLWTALYDALIRGSRVVEG